MFAYDPFTGFRVRMGKKGDFLSASFNGKKKTTSKARAAPTGKQVFLAAEKD